MAHKVVLLVLFALSTLLPAAPREAEWKQVADATGKDQPQTVLGLLKPIETAAFAEQAWAEGTKALAMRVAIDGKLKGGLQFSIKQLASEIPGTPAAARPLLRLLQAHWLSSYYHDHGWNLDRRSSIGPAADGDIETWDATRLRTEIDGRFQDSLADQAALQKIPVAEFGDLLEKGDLGDEFRPTLYDFIAHAALEFYTTGDSSAAQPCDAFEIDAASAALDPSDAFLAWHPDAPDHSSRNFRSLRLYQDLLTFHRADPDPSAFLHCDLERIRWAGQAAAGPNKAARLDAALRAFIETNAKHPVSADARLDLAGALIEKKRTLEAHALAKAGADAFPDHPFGKLCQNTVSDLEEKRLEVLGPNHWTRSGESIVLNHANVAHVWLRAYRQKWQIDASTLGGDPTPVDGYSDRDEEVAAFLRTTPVKAWDAPLRDDHDFAPRVTSLPAPVDLSPGYYIIVASGDAGFSLKNNHLSAMGVRVTTHVLVVREESDRLAGLVTDAITGAPRAGIEVHYYYEHDQKIASGSTTSNADGWFGFPQFKEDPRDLVVVAGTGDDIAILRPRNFSKGFTNEDYGKPWDGIIFFTDRAIYRPGQTISFKGIWCHSDWKKCDYRILAGKKTSVVFRDPNQKQLQQVDVVTNEYGSFSGTFTAPAGGLNGECSISAGDLGSVGIRVEEYKRPKFSAAIQAPAAPVTLGAQVSISGSASSFTGAPIDGATVKWRVTRDSRWPEWMRWSGLTPDIGTREIATGTATTAADGAFTIKFPAVPDRAIDPATDPEFTYQIVADVTDPTGETCQTETSVSVAYTTLKAEVSAVALLLANQPAAFHIRTASHDGDGRPAGGVLRIFKLIEPAVCSRGKACEKIFADCDAETFPPGNSADPARWATGERVAELPVKTSPDDHADLRRGEANVSTSLEAGAYRAVFVTADANGRQVQELCNLQVVDPSSARFPTKIPFFTACNSDKIEPGRVFTLVWGSGHPSARACVEWFKNGALLKREWSAPDRTQQVFSLTSDESMRGGFTVSVTQTTLNCPQLVKKSIEVPWTNKDLGLRWEHLTSKLQPGAKDTWTAVITGPDGAAAAVEMAATLYDSSLDSFTRHDWPELGHLFRSENEPFDEEENEDEFAEFHDYGNWDFADAFTFEYPYRRFQCADILRAPHDGRHRSNTQASFLAGIPYQLPQQNNSGGAVAVDPFGSSADSHSPSGDASPNKSNRTPKPDVSQVTARKNLQETAFFYPHLTSNDKGEVRITFTMPEALAKWRFLGFAHDRNLRSGTLEGETVTAKDLMVQPNPPRFLREGDVLDFTVKITNQSDKAQAGSARLTLSDAATQKDATAALGIAAPDQPWSIPAKESRTLSWRLTVPDGSRFLTYKALATSGTLSDGEEGWLPVIPRRVMLTESMVLPIRDAGTKDFQFQKLLDSGKSATLENRLVQVQVVSQPAWYAVMALPYLMEFPHECAEQTFNRYYANALARHIAKSNPKIRRIFDLWKNTPALDSPLAKNADLKGILLEDTPWLNEASDQSQARRKLGLLFDDNHLGEQLEVTMKKLADIQNPDGLWPWFPGCHSNPYISLYIATGFARLRALGVETDITPALKALPQLDASLTERLASIKKAAEKDPAILAANHLDSLVAHHLYTRTFFLKDAAVKRADKEAFDYFTAQARKYWSRLNSRMSRAHVALALARLGDMDTARLITRSLREHAVSNEDTGMSWQDAEGEDRWYWWQAPIETQAMMIEAFREIDHDDQAVEACQVWLIKQMQVHDWRTTKATADAIHALLMGGKDLLGRDALLQVSLGGTQVKPEGVEPGTGFYEARFSGPSIKPEMGSIQLTKTVSGVAWASVHWQYLEDMAKTTEHNATPLKLEKALFVRKNTGQGPRLDPVNGPVKVGDEIVTRLVLRNDRAMEFVHLKDLRGSGTEPVNVLSGYRWQDGFGYYEVTRDTASHFFIDTLPAGTHVFESSVRVQHAGIYQTGAAEIRCMYAPEFSAHSASVKLEVGQ